MKLTHRPKGRMCINCIFFNEDNHCEDLNFSEMQKIGKDSDGTIVVKCSGFHRANKVTLSENRN